MLLHFVRVTMPVRTHCMNFVLLRQSWDKVLSYATKPSLNPAITAIKNPSHKCFDNLSDDNGSFLHWHGRRLLPIVHD